MRPFISARLLVGTLLPLALAVVLRVLPAAAQSNGTVQSTPSQPAAQSTQSAPSQPASPSVTPAAPAAKSVSKTGNSTKPVKPGGPPTRYLPNRFAGRAGTYYKMVWGVDGLSVKLTESGQIVRFSWRVVDPARAKQLSNKEAQPSLVDPQAGVSLVVPTLENIGMMRQASAPEEGKTYWMAFSNKGRIVKKGDRVNVVIGQFRADGLAVDD